MSSAEAQPLDTDVIVSPSDLRVEGSLSTKTGATAVSSLFQLVIATAVGVITARLLGPAGKGTFATLAFLGIVAATLAGGGLGEAAVVRVGQGLVSINDAIAATLAGVAATSVVAVMCMLGAGIPIFAGQWAKAGVPLIIAVASVPAAAYFDALQQLLNAREHIVATSKLAAVAAATTALATFVFLGPLHWGLVGAVAAVPLGPAVAGLGCVVVLRRLGCRLAVRWDSRHIRWGLGYGSKVQSAYLAGTLAARVDLLLVFSIAGSRQAGYYSIALTIGVVVGILPWAVSSSTFPRIASLSAPDGRQLTVTVCRLGLIGALCTALALAVVTPVALPLLYGRAFSPAVLPAIILIVGGPLSAVQGLLCIGISARGDPKLLLVATVTIMSVMIAADLVVIGFLGILGAATVSALSPTVGLLTTIPMRSRIAADIPYIRELVPRPDDFRLALHLVSRLAVSVKRRCLERLGLAAKS